MKDPSPTELDSRLNRFPVLDYTADPVVSTDVIGPAYSSIFDAGLTSVPGRVPRSIVDLSVDLAQPRGGRDAHLGPRGLTPRQ
jgi:hypothetical protein